MNCTICKRESDTEFCSSCLARVAAMLAKPPKEPKRDDRVYWYVTDGVFECMVHHVSDEAEARRVAYSPLQAWYFNTDYVNPMHDTRIRRISHDEYVAWLRKADEPSTIKNST